MRRDRAAEGDGDGDVTAWQKEAGREADSCEDPGGVRRDRAAGKETGTERRHLSLVRRPTAVKTRVEAVAETGQHGGRQRTYRARARAMDKDRDLDPA